MARVPQVLIGKAPCMSVYMYSYSIKGPLISSQFLNVVFHKQGRTCLVTVFEVPLFDDPNFHK